MSWKGEASHRQVQRTTLIIIKDNLRVSMSLSNFQDRCKRHLVSGAVTRPFWNGFPLCNIHLSIMPDILHQLYQGMVKHLIHWCSSLMSEKELDDRICCLPPCFSVRHFKKGWSELSQVSGKERKDMARILLGCLIGKAPSQVILCYHTILDFVYIAQYPSHDNNTLQYLDDALKLFHDNKHILTDLNLVPVREHLNILKFHAMIYYAQAIRDFGITDNYNTKMFKRASNFHDELPSNGTVAGRQEKVNMFESYLEHYEIKLFLDPNYALLSSLSIRFLSGTHVKMGVKWAASRGY
ncbi:uncharacterized protein F5147DRAFT_744681 [Suillus discolor]|uniref:Uncharacterized protein n=1 Tax=Suillus discolor TaxID=1912936 RepID=A0A9P7JWB0_9AGAM|nr:uncharacterized protein F5147DRAFT_744681 [Suillus discolor]KAG2112065.1 hypothetical protein F5147DRAFT_744681 [Suillus discolor]